MNFPHGEKVVLQFSGGKDSIACLMLLKDYLDEITVLWVDTGDSFPETHQQMVRVRAMCPHFVSVASDQPAQISRCGIPSDVLPVRSHVATRPTLHCPRPLIQSYMECCSQNLWQPMWAAVRALRASVVVRGQRSSDGQKSPVKNGDVVDGVRYWFPIEDWSEQAVLDFVKDSPLLTDHYAHARTSLDCMHCTAYLSENMWKLPYLLRHHEAVGREVHRRLSVIQHEVNVDMKAMALLTGAV